MKNITLSLIVGGVGLCVAIQVIALTSSSMEPTLPTTMLTLTNHPMKYCCSVALDYTRSIYIFESESGYLLSPTGSSPGYSSKTPASVTTWWLGGNPAVYQPFVGSTYGFSGTANIDPNFNSTYSFAQLTLTNPMDYYNMFSKGTTGQYLDGQFLTCPAGYVVTATMYDRYYGGAAPAASHITCAPIKILCKWRAESETSAFDANTNYLNDYYQFVKKSGTANFYDLDSAAVSRTDVRYNKTDLIYNDCGGN